MSANWPLMSVNVFFVGYDAQWPSMACFARCGEYPNRVRFMDVRFKTASKGMLAFRRVLWHAVWSTISSRVRQHAALTGINGSLAEINVEKPACEARSKEGVSLE